MKKILSLSAENWIVIATFLAVLVALFQERIKSYWNRAVFDMKINLSPPDSHQISLTDQTGQITGQTIYIRIKVVHKKGSAGENIEIIPINFWRVDSENNLSKLNYFLPISLVWSHLQPRSNIIRISVGLFRHCDFGHFIKAPNGDQALLVLDTMVQPNPVSEGEIPNIIRPGKYQFELLLSGDNTKPMKKKWQIEFNEWSDDEAEMLDNNIRIEEL